MYELFKVNLKDLFKKYAIVSIIIFGIDLIALLIHTLVSTIINFKLKSKFGNM